MPLADMSRLVYDNLMKFPLFVMGRIDKNPTEERERSCNLRQSNDRNMMTALFFTLISESTDTSQLDRHTECQHKTSPTPNPDQEPLPGEKRLFCGRLRSHRSNHRQHFGIPDNHPGQGITLLQPGYQRNQGIYKSQYNDGKKK